MRTFLRTAGPPAFVVLLLALAGFWRLGYGYGTGDHEELLPQLLRLLDPSLFPTDPYLQGLDESFSVRFVFLHALWALSLVLTPPVAVFAVSAAALLGRTWAAWRLAYALVPSRTAATLAVLATYATAYWTPGGNALLSSTLAPEAIAWIPALLAVEAFARDRPALAAVLVGGTAWVQTLMGLQVGLLLGLVALWQAADTDWQAGLRRAVAFGALVFAVASPILVPTLLTQVGAPPVPADGLSTFFVTARLRQPHHYLLFSQSARVLVQFGLVLAVGLGGLWVLRQRGEPRTEHVPFAARTLAVIGALVAVYAVMTEGFENLTVAKMQFFRLTVLAKLMLLAWAAGAAVALVPPAARAWTEGLFDRTRLGWAVALVALAGTAGLAAADVGRPGAMWRVDEHRTTDLYQVEDWIRHHTPPDALFLVPPSTTTFRSHALRSVAISFKPTTFRDDAMHQWLADLRAVAPAPLPARDGGAWRASLDSAYFAHTPAEWEDVAARFGADYALLDRQSTRTPPTGRPVFEAGRWAVYRLARGTERNRGWRDGKQLPPHPPSLRPPPSPGLQD